MNPTFTIILNLFIGSRIKRILIFRLSLLVNSVLHFRLPVNQSISYLILHLSFHSIISFNSSQFKNNAIFNEKLNAYSSSFPKLIRFNQRLIVLWCGGYRSYISCEIFYEFRYFLLELKNRWNRLRTRELWTENSALIRVYFFYWTDC